MGTEQKIKERVTNAVAKSYFKPWYKRAQGKVVVAILAVLVLFLLYFVILLINNLVHINRGDIFNPELAQWTTYEKYQENQKNVTQIFTEDDPAWGTEEPLVYVVAYESFGCPYCQHNQTDLKNIEEKFGSIIHFVFKDFPTEGTHTDVFTAHLAAGCAQDQDKFWEYHDLLFTNQGNFSKPSLKKYAVDLGLDTNKFNACLDNEEHNQEIREDYAQGVNLGAQGTPTYIINGQMVPGEIPYALWEEIIGFIIKQQS